MTGHTDPGRSHQTRAREQERISDGRGQASKTNATPSSVRCAVRCRPRDIRPGICPAATPKRIRSGLSDSRVLPSQGCGRQPGHGGEDKAEFSRQRCAELRSVPRWWPGASPRAHPRLSRGWRHVPTARLAMGPMGSRSAAPRLPAEQMGHPAGPELARGSALCPRCSEGGKLSSQGQLSACPAGTGSLCCLERTCHGAQCRPALPSPGSTTTRPDRC